MNFSNTPKRSSADDELDQVLNAWAESHSASSEESPREAQIRSSTTDAVEFHRWANETLRSEPAATGPAAGTWNRVLHHVEQKSPRGTASMSATTADAAGNAAIVYDPRPYNRKEMTLSRFANIAATVAIVFAVSVGGWFAMSQLPPGGEGRFGAFQASPEVAQSGTCDVEPLNVDEVIAIVENPYSVVDPEWFATPPPDSDVYEEDLIQNQDYVDASWMQQNLIPPTSMAAYSVPEEPTFDSASAAAQEYLDCLATGTQGQIWALTEPTVLQGSILVQYPIYRDEATIRSSIEERINDVPGERLAELPYGTSRQEYTNTTNPRRGDARVWLTDSPEFLDYDKVLFIGIRATDEDGNVVYVEDWNATTVEGDKTQANSASLILIHSESRDQWFFVGWNAPRG